MTCRILPPYFATKQLLTGLKGVFVPRSFVIQSMLQTMLKCSPNCWNVDAGTSSRDVLLAAKLFA